MNNKKTTSIFSFGFWLCIVTLLTAPQTSAQKPPTGVLQEIENGVFVLEATLPFEVTENECKADLVKCLTVESTIYDGSKAGILFEDIEGDAEAKKVPILNRVITANCDGSGFPAKGGEFCLSVNNDNLLLVIYRFVETPTLENDKYSLNAVIKDNRLSREVAGGYAAITKLEFPLKDPEVAALSDTDRSTNTNLKKMFTVGGQKDIEDGNNVIRVRIELPDKARTTDDDKEKLKKGRILLRRVREILRWLDAQERNPPNIATVQTDLRDGSGVKPFRLVGFAYIGQDKNRVTTGTASQSCGLEGAVPIELQPLTERELALYCDSRLTLYLVGAQNLPSQQFLFKVEFQQNPPLELALVAKATPVGSGVKALTAPDAKAVGDNKELDLRTFKTNLDLGLTYTNSVEEVERDGQTVRERQNNGAVDLMFAPIFNKYLTKPKSVQLLTTPFFIDAKASFDRTIEKNTLSLNRTLIGSDLSLLIIGKETPGDLTHPNDSDKYRMSFRFINASDRDFKRVEAKFNFETLIRLVALNRPLSLRSKFIPASVLNPKAGGTVVPTGKFGYQIQPTFGFDLGRVYRDKRDAFSNEEQTKFVRRFYIGLDMQFDLTRRATLTIKDTYYIRGEAPEARYRNYFLGELSTPLGKLTRNVAQSVFFSFERGEQPPFVSPRVNAFKVGYRITSNFFRDVSAP